MPKPKSSEGEVVEEASVVDETENQTPDEETPEGEVEEETPQEPGEGESEGGEGAGTAGGETETPGEGETTPPKEDVPPSAAQLAALLKKKKDLEAEVERLKGEKPADAAPAPKAGERVSAIQTFLTSVLPQAKKQFTEAQLVTVKDDGSVTVNPKAAEEQFNALYTTTNHMIGSVVADHINPVMDALAELVITLQNELEIRDLRSHQRLGTVFTELEGKVRDALGKAEWKTRREKGSVQKLFHSLLGERNGESLLTAPRGEKKPASDALKDLSAGTRTKPAQKSVGFKLTPEQEADYADMVTQGWSGTREQYYAKYKARAEKLKAAGKPIPKTFRSYT